MLGIGWLKHKLAVKKFNQLWCQHNSHNFTSPVGLIPIEKVSIGNNTYGSIDVSFANDQNRLVIGSYCSIAGGVKFLPSTDHAHDRISTYPFKALLLTGEMEAVSKGDIIVDDDVWIGYGATILSGVHIGQGAVIAAGAVVNKDVPPYAIVGGVPAKVLKYRFSSEIIQQLINVDYSQLTEDMVRAHTSQLYETLTDTKQLAWMPKKKD